MVSVCSPVVHPLQSFTEAAEVGARVTVNVKHPGLGHAAKRTALNTVMGHGAARRLRVTVLFMLLAVLVVLGRPNRTC